jgi:beta-lactamase superfamily II metal-dependent hydrolase
MRTLRIILLFFCALVFRSTARASSSLEIYFVDVEGGQATLIVAPSGESMLIDTGSPGFDGRDPDRIVAAAKAANVSRIDCLIITHHHSDHVGGVAQLAERMPIGSFIDHGPSVETGTQAAELAAAYSKASQKGRHRVIMPGDQIPLRGVEVQVLTANGRRIVAPLEGAGRPNPFCAGVKRQADDLTENARSVGILVTFGKFRFIDLGDLTVNKELDLMCPNNSVGTVDVYLTSHHGLKLSGSPALVHALHPRVAIMNNGARKGGEAEAWKIVQASPGLEDLWQLHYAIAGGKQNNVAEKYIANPDEPCEGKYLVVSAQADGGFTVTNSRSGFSKNYPAKN